MAINKTSSSSNLWNTIISSILEHHSNLLPWIEKSKVKIINDKNGIIDLKELKKECRITFLRNAADRWNLEKHVEKTKKVEGFKNSEPITNEELLILECDFLIPCALGNVITKNNADKIKAKIIVEGANGPVSSEADEILLGKNIKVIPGILANAGGVTVSYFEWVQDIQRLFWEEEEIMKNLERLMTKSFKEVHKLTIEKKTDYRTAALMIAIERVAKAKELRGLYP